MGIKVMIKKKFLNADGTINKTVVASFVTLALLLIQQIMVSCSRKVTLSLISTFLMELSEERMSIRSVEDAAP